MTSRVSIPTTGKPIGLHEGRLDVPDTRVLYIEGDGIGIDITPVMLKVVDKAVDLAYQGKRKIIWTEILPGKKPAVCMVKINGCQKKHCSY